MLSKPSKVILAYPNHPRSPHPKGIFCANFISRKIKFIRPQVLNPKAPQRLSTKQGSAHSYGQCPRALLWLIRNLNTDPIIRTMQQVSHWGIYPESKIFFEIPNFRDKCQKRVLWPNGQPSMYSDWCTLQRSPA
jgi:hypothetical protein